MKGILTPNTSPQTNHVAVSKPWPRPQTSQPPAPLQPQFRAAKSLLWKWIRITLTQSMACEQFPPNPLILNSREKINFAKLQDFSSIKVPPRQLRPGNASGTTVVAALTLMVLDAFAETTQGGLRFLISAQGSVVVPADRLLHVFADAFPGLVGAAEAVHRIGIAGGSRLLIPAKGFFIVLWHAGSGGVDAAEAVHGVAVSCFGGFAEPGDGSREVLGRAFPGFVGIRELGHGLRAA